METLSHSSRESADCAQKPGAIDAVRPLLIAHGISTISPDGQFVVCPGVEFHTTPTAPRDCKVFVRTMHGVLIPLLHCFHGSCCQRIKECNHRLFQSAMAEHRSASEMVRRSRLHQYSVWQSESPAIQDILTQYSWTLREITNDEKGQIESCPEDHYIKILSLYADDDILWTAGDVRETGTREHASHFRTAREWMEKPRCPGAFICPNTFQSGVFSRAKSNVLALKYLVVESDLLNRDQVGAVFRWMQSKGHTLRAVVDTAGKSLHGWFDYPPAICIPSLKRDLVALKCDPSMFGESQPCRLPGARRGQEFQRLIYLSI